ncbi:RNA ligase family protein [Caulobacter sp. KR2-114]|uniref:ATP-dependent DNA ligase n=1 Tax=Caulobacter sp. KR2-114 TaxID=3400912 RepID=UPI003C0EA347
MAPSTAPAARLSQAAFSPQLAAQANAPPAGPDWVHEIKVDGYRTFAFIRDGSVRLVTRGGHDWTHRYGDLGAQLASLPCNDAVIDGEIAVPDHDGVTRLSGLQAALTEGHTGSLVFHAFDLLRLNGADLREHPLLQRKAALASLVAALGPKADRVALCAVHRDGATLFRMACERGMEGIVSKKVTEPYVGGRSRTWLKVKRQEHGQFRIAGFIANRPGYVSSVALMQTGEPDWRPICRANVGSFGQALFDALEPMTALPAPRGPRGYGKIRWIAPVWRAEVVYLGRTARGAPRAPVLSGFARDTVLQ